jgi:hypothetical protein
MGNLDLALPLCEEALAGRRRVMGNAHPNMLDPINNMAILRNDMGEHMRPACSGDDDARGRGGAAADTGRGPP